MANQLAQTGLTVLDVVGRTSKDALRVAGDSVANNGPTALTATADGMVRGATFLVNTGTALYQQTQQTQGTRTENTMETGPNDPFVVVKPFAAVEQKTTPGSLDVTTATATQGYVDESTILQKKRDILKRGGFFVIQHEVEGCQTECDFKSKVSIPSASPPWEFINTPADGKIIAFRDTSAGFLERVIPDAKVQEWGSEDVLFFNAER